MNLLILALLSTARADDLRGYTELRVSWAAGADGQQWNTVERLRPTWETDLHERVSLQATPQILLVQGRDMQVELARMLNEQLGDVFGPLGCELQAPPRVDEIGDVLSVERLFVDVYAPRFDLRVGRQALNWGSASFINPTDLYAQVLLTEPWRQRQGVSAARITLPLGERAQVVAVAALNDELHSGRFALRPRVNLLGTDVALVASYFSAPSAFDEGRSYLGWDVRGELGLGFWSEGLMEVGEWAPTVSSGVDYSFPVLDQLLVVAQYTYDGAPQATGGLQSAMDLTELAGPGCDLLLAQMEPVEPQDWTRPARFTSGSHYGLVAANLRAFDVYGASLAGLMNLEDRSGMLIPSVSWTPGSAWTLSGGAQLPFGEGEFHPTGTDLQVEQGPITLDFGGLVPSLTAFAYARYAL